MFLEFIFDEMHLRKRKRRSKREKERENEECSNDSLEF